MRASYNYEIFPGADQINGFSTAKYGTPNQIVTIVVDEYVVQILNNEPRPLRAIDDAIPEKLESICLKCLSKHIAERYTTAGDLAKDL